MSTSSPYHSDKVSTDTLNHCLIKLSKFMCYRVTPKAQKVFWSEYFACVDQTTSQLSQVTDKDQRVLSAGNLNNRETLKCIKLTTGDVIGLYAISQSGVSSEARRYPVVSEAVDRGDAVETWRDLCDPGLNPRLHPRKQAGLLPERHHFENMKQRG